MDLKTFIAESLTQIAEGIREAQKSDTGAIFNPRTRHNGKGQQNVAHERNPHYAAQIVAFDVAVTVTEAGGKGGDFKVSIPWISIGGGAGSSNENASTSRIHFEIPVRWPEGSPREK